MNHIMRSNFDIVMNIHVSHLWYQIILASPQSPTGSSTSPEQNSSYLTYQNSFQRQISIRVFVSWIIRCSSEDESIQAGCKEFHFLTVDTSSQGYSAHLPFRVLISRDTILSSHRVVLRQRMLDIQNEGKIQNTYVTVIHRLVIIGVTSRNIGI